MKPHSRALSIGLIVLTLATCVAVGQAQDLADLERLADADVKPFVVVQGLGTGAVARAQGVMISTRVRVDGGAPLF